MKIAVHIRLKKGVLDPQGQTSMVALAALGFDNVNDLRIGKEILIDLDENDPEKAKQQAISMCEKLLANIVIEDYEIEIL